ncbi:MAG: DUF177 domain-containing protein [Thermoleophilaceae bacterium]
MAALTDTFDLGSSAPGLRRSRVAWRSRWPSQPLELRRHRPTRTPSWRGTPCAWTSRAPRARALRCACGYEVALDGPCMRCLERRPTRSIGVDAREVDQPGGGDELASPYLREQELDVRAWTRDALALALPTQIVCREDCAGLCPQCGENLNRHPGHAHEPEPDPRWAKLSS